jgi:pyridoxal phosphate enzyme (YggS family)
MQNSKTSESSLERYKDVQLRIAAAAERVGRQADEITLVAVSKTFPAENIEPFLRSGHRTFGENRVQEAQAKWPELRDVYSGIKLHLIGPLQSNKTRDAMELFDCIETVDREKLALEIAKMSQKLGSCPELFIQVNTGMEPQKAGIEPASADSFIRSCREQHDLPVTGLMCIPPVEEEPSLHFALLAKIAERNGIAQLSMGMSHDFEIAIEFGATHVRIGSALFGERDYR